MNEISSMKALTNYIEASLTRMATIKIKKKKRHTIASVEKDVQKVEPLHLAGRDVKWFSPIRKQFEKSSKLYIWSYHMTQQFYT